MVACASSSVPSEDNPCDPPPLCADAMEQTFGILLENREGAIPSLQLSQNASSPANYQVSVSRLEKESVWRIDFLRPDQLFWLSDTQFMLYQALASKGYRELILSVEKIKIDCCPQFRIVKMEYEGRVICTECWEKQPILLP